MHGMCKTYNTDDTKTDEKSSRTAGSECSTRTDKETSTNGTTNCNHVHMPSLESLVELIVLVGKSTALERIGSKAKTGHERRSLCRIEVVNNLTIVAELW